MNHYILPILISFVGLQYFGYSQEKPKIVKVPAKVLPADDGHAMFTSYCASCHGATGKGDGPAAPALKSMPADLTQLNRKNRGQFPSVRVTKTIEGIDVPAHGSRDMPIWGNVFSPMHSSRTDVQLRIHNLTAYVESIQEK